MANMYAAARGRHLRLGRRGEALAAAFLTECGLDVLVRNYRCAHGEIDIVARDGAVLCFVEVKTRRRSGRFRPADAVGREKKRRIVRAAHQYLREIGRPRVLWRYDVIEVVLGRWFLHEIRYWPAAFGEEDVGGPLGRKSDVTVRHFRDRA